MPSFDPQFLLQAFGITFIAIGLAARLGLWKKWFWRTRGSVYSYIPLGLMFLLYAFGQPLMERLGSNLWMFQALFGVLIAIGIWFSFRPPSFVKPTWVRWVEGHPQHIIRAMEDAVKDDHSWESHVASREAVDAWAKQLERKKPRPKAKK